MICFVTYGVNIYVNEQKLREKKYDILMIFFLFFFWKFSMILADFLLPRSITGSVSLKQIRIRLNKLKRIQTDPDSQRCFL